MRYAYLMLRDYWIGGVRLPILCWLLARMGTPTQCVMLCDTFVVSLVSIMRKVKLGRLASETVGFYVPPTRKKFRWGTVFPTGPEEKLIMRELEGEWIIKKEMRMISKDGTISEFPGYTSSKEEEDEEEDEGEEEEEEKEESEKEDRKRRQK
ncbi:hypothetical protein Tco_0083693 [Tanacetum coccineum]